MSPALALFGGATAEQLAERFCSHGGRASVMEYLGSLPRADAFSMVGAIAEGIWDRGDYGDVEVFRRMLIDADLWPRSYTVKGHDADETVLGENLSLDEALELHEKAKGHATVFDEHTGEPADFQTLGLEL